MPHRSTVPPHPSPLPMGEAALLVAWGELSHGKHRMDGLDAADRDLFRAAGYDARGHDLACDLLSGSRAGGRVAHSDDAWRPIVPFADHDCRDSFVVDRSCRHRPDPCASDEV